MDLLRSISARASHALVLNGALSDDREVDAVARHVAAEIERSGLRTQSVTLRDVQVAPCLGCFECWTRSPGICKTHDAGRDLARAYVRSHLVAFVTPVTFGGYSSELKKAVDRMLCVELPFFTRVGGEVHHRPRYDRRPALLVIGVLREPVPAQERIFHELARRNAINLQPPAFGSQVLVRARGVDDAIEPHLRGAIAGVLDRSGPRSGLAVADGGAR
jgi:hypothetical protein